MELLARRALISDPSLRAPPSSLYLSRHACVRTQTSPTQTSPMHAPRFDVWSLTSDAAARERVEALALLLHHPQLGATVIQVPDAPTQRTRLTQRT